MSGYGLIIVHQESALDEIDAVYERIEDCEERFLVGVRRVKAEAKPERLEINTDGVIMMLWLECRAAGG